VIILTKPKIDKKIWQEFKFDKIFTISRGKRLIKIDQINGNVAYVSSSKKNNGIDNYILPPDDMEIYQNALTLSNSGSVGYCFYHAYEFVASDHCTIIQIKDKKIELNNYISLFLKPVIESMKTKYNFAREINNARLKKETILLPRTKNKDPDWTFMERYIKYLSSEIKYDSKIAENQISKQKVKLKIEQWGEFKLSEIFKIIRGKRLVEIDRVIGEVPYYSASDYDNGLTDKISNPLFVEEDALIYTTFGKCYYVENEFTASDEISILKNKNLNIYTGLFVATIITENKSKYTFGRKAFETRFSKDIIKLPITKDKKPDWAFMETYIKSLNYSSAL
jgi:hypothetical protein